MRRLPLTMSLTKLDGPPLLADQVFEAIRTSILNGDMPAGYRLRIRDLAAQVGTSVMPVREAIRRLEEAGLAAREPHKGAVVRGLTLSELAHVYDVRRLLEVEGARLGAASIRAADVESMQREYTLMRAAVEDRRTVAVLDHDEALLTVLYEASGNPVLVNAIRTLWERCRSYKIVGATATLDADDPSPLWTYQEQLLAAARANDPELAARINGASLGNATSRIRDQLAAENAREHAAGEPEGRLSALSPVQPSSPERRA